VRAYFFTEAMLILVRNGFVELDASDFEKVSGLNWYIDANGYAARRLGCGKVEYMHRLIVDCEREMHVDHKNGQPSDNRRQNLRKCTRSQNMWNRGKNKANLSGLKGVSKRSETSWKAEIRANGKRIQLGSFRTAEAAHAAYCKAATELHGCFANHG
jgi:hypothetical protein